MFHAVGPNYRDGKHDEPEELASCYARCLEMAEELDVRSISFPAISTGAYGYPAAEAARISLDAVARHLKREVSAVREILFVLFDQGSYDVHVQAAKERFPDQLQ